MTRVELIITEWTWIVSLFVCLFDLILYVQSTIFQLNRDGSSWVEPVLSYSVSRTLVTPVFC